MSPWGVVRLAVLRGLLLAGLLGLVGGLAGVFSGLVAVPITFVEQGLEARRPVTLSVAAIGLVSLTLWLGTFLLLAAAHAQAVHAGAILEGGSVADGLAAIDRELTRLRTTHPEDLPIAWIHFEALALGSAATAAPLRVLVRLAPSIRGTRPDAALGFESAVLVLLAWGLPISAQVLLTTATMGGREVAPLVGLFTFVLCGTFSGASAVLVGASFWATGRVAEWRERGAPSAVT